MDLPTRTAGATQGCFLDRVCEGCSYHRRPVHSDSHSNDLQDLSVSQFIKVFLAESREQRPTTNPLKEALQIPSLRIPLKETLLLPRCWGRGSCRAAQEVEVSVAASQCSVGT